MNPDCRNDCVEPLVFPKRPNNRPGLSHIDYRIGSYSDFRETLLRNLNHEAVLEAWTHRDADDPGIALLEGASILGDILSFYQDLYANEAFLRTAQWRESIADLVRLLGYRLSPGLGGKATFAFEVKNDKPVVVPAGFPLQAQVEGLEQAADFETVEETTAYPSLSKFYLYRPTYIPDLSGEISVFSIKTSELEAAGVEINAKDRLMLLDTVSEATNNAQIVIVKEIEQEFDRTNITIEGIWDKGGGLSEVIAYKLGRTFRHFGHNAPRQIVKIDSDDSVSQLDITYNRKLHSSTTTTGNTTITPSFTSREIPLDIEVESLLIGNMLIIEGVSVHESAIVRIIRSFRSGSMAWGSLSGATTFVGIDDDMDDLRFGHTHDVTDIRNLSIHETVGLSLTLKQARQSDPMADGLSLYYFGDSVSYKQLNDRGIAFQKEDGIFLEMVVSTEDKELSDDEEKLRPIFLSSPLAGDFTLSDFSLVDPKVTVYGNLVEATQGKTEKEAVLGNGDSRQQFQTFKLPKAPLTYHNSPGETPPEVPELQIYVNDHLWTRVASFFNVEPQDEIYIVREDANGDSWVQFGDGKTGARLPSGIRNLVAIYRAGTGAYGALKEETTVQAKGKLDRLDKIQLPGVASGGSEPETGENARQAAPGKIQSLDRLVSLKDFESETLAIPGILKAAAAWELVDNVPAIVLTVLMETGRDQEIDEVREILNDYNKCRGPQRFPIIVHQGHLQYVHIDAVFALDATFREEPVKKAIKEALGVTGEEGDSVDGSAGLFGLGQRWFGENEYATRIAGTMQNVQGVVWAKVTALGSLGEADDPAELMLPAEPKPLQDRVSCISEPTQHILSLYGAHLYLSVSKAESADVC